jgi:trimeric autotransporter adhesin
MKPIFFSLSTFLLLCFLNINTWAQPSGFRYQTVSRDNSGQPLRDQTMAFRIGIHTGSGQGTLIYSETHLVKSDAQGVANLTIGEGSVQSGAFASIDWSKGPYFLSIETDQSGGSNFELMGSSELLSVPYALYAGHSAQTDQGTISWVDGPGTVTTNQKVGIGLGNPVGKVEIQGDPSMDIDAPLFEVKDRNGNTVFAVYEEGVRVYVIDQPGKGGRGGFAVGGRTASKGVTSDILTISPDSVRIYIEDQGAKGGKGGFAVGGRSPSKGVNSDILRVTADSIRMYINDTISKGGRGGFAVGGRTASKGSTNNYLNLNPENYLIGHQSGVALTTGLYNSFLGYQSGIHSTSGSNNVLLGYQTGYFNTSGSSNVLIGNKSGYSSTTGTSNVFLGNTSGYSNIIGKSNVFLGDSAGFSNLADYNVFLGKATGKKITTGSFNTFLGYQAGLSNVVGSSNIFIGYKAGLLNSTSYNIMIGNEAGVSDVYGDYNLFMGYQSGFKNYSGDNNSFIGYQSGYSNSSGYENVFLGYKAGYANTTGFRGVFIGYNAGLNNTTGSYNIFLGRQAGEANTTGTSNLYMGEGSGQYNVDGILNTFLGKGTGSNQTTGSYNIYIGAQSAIYKASGDGNTFVGVNTGRYVNGNYNLLLGYFAGDAHIGSRNVLIGYGAGSDLATDQNDAFRLEYYTYPRTKQPLLAGSFATNTLTVNGIPGSYTLEVDGTFKVTGNDVSFTGLSTTSGSGAGVYYLSYNTSTGKITPYLVTSARRFKKDILSMEEIDWLYKLRPVNYSYLNDPASHKEYGLIAEEVEQVNPSLVSYDKDGKIETVGYNSLIAPMLKAIQEQQDQILKLKEENSVLNKKLEKVDQLESELTELKSQLQQLILK